jgi:hypothetical protein
MVAGFATFVTIEKIWEEFGRQMWKKCLARRSHDKELIVPFFYFTLGRNGTRVPEPKRTPLGYILPYYTSLIRRFIIT